MITRLMISLRKAAHLQGSTWSMGESTVNVNRSPCLSPDAYKMRFAPNRDLGKGRADDDTLVSPITQEV